MKNVIFFTCFFVISSSVISQEIESHENFVQRYFYRDHVVSFEKFYGDDKKLDSLKTYYNSGELNEEFNYTKGRFDGLSFKYNKKGEKLTTWKFEKGKLIERTDHKIEFTKKTEEKVKNAHSKLKVLNETLKQTPNDFKSTYKRASIRKYLGNHTLALNDFKKIEKNVVKISKTKKIPEKILGGIYDHLANIYSGYEMLNHTIHYKYKALKASPKESRLYHNLGSYLVRIKTYRLGINYLNIANEMVPNHSFANWALSMAYTDLEDYNKAMTCVNTAFKNEASLYKRGEGTAERDLWTIRGLLYHKLGETEKGIIDLEEAININKDNSFANRNLGVIHYEIGNYELACQYLNKAKELGYEKIHDRKDIQGYLDSACEKANKLEDILEDVSEGVSEGVLEDVSEDVSEDELTDKSESIKTTRLVNRPYVYPNPGKDIVRIKNLSFEKFTYEIYDYTTKLISRNTSVNGTVSVSNLPQGVYILKVISDNGLAESFRIIKE